MSINLENCGILREDILKGVVDRLVKQTEQRVFDQAIEKTLSIVNENVSRKVIDTVDRAISKRVSELMQSEIQPLTIWGEKKGEPRTIEGVLEQSLVEYWTQKVDASGKLSTSYHSKPRAEYLALKIASEVFTQKAEKEFKQIILNAKTQVSDSLVEAIRKIADKQFGINHR